MALDTAIDSAQSQGATARNGKTDAGRNGVDDDGGASKEDDVTRMMLVHPEPTAVVEAEVTIGHIQLRDLIVCPKERGVVWYVSQRTIVEHDILTPGSIPNVLCRLNFIPVALAALPVGDDEVLLAAGSQEADLYLALFAYRPRTAVTSPSSTSASQASSSAFPGQRQGGRGSEDQLRFIPRHNDDNENDHDDNNDMDHDSGHGPNRAYNSRSTTPSTLSDAATAPRVSEVIWNCQSVLSGSINNSVLLYMPPSSGLGAEGKRCPRLVVSNNDWTITFFDVSLEPGGFGFESSYCADGWRVRGGRGYHHMHSGRVHGMTQRTEVVGALKLGVPVNHTSVSPDGRTILSCGDSPNVYLHRIVNSDSDAPGTPLVFKHIATYTLPQSRLPPPSMAFLNSNPSSYGNGYTWQSAAAGASNPSSSCFSTSWSSDGTKFVVASQEGMVAVWDVRSKEPLSMAVWETEREQERVGMRLRMEMGGTAGPPVSARGSGSGPTWVVMGGGQRSSGTSLGSNNPTAVAETIRVGVLEPPPNSNSAANPNVYVLDSPLQHIQMPEWRYLSSETSLSAGWGVRSVKFVKAENGKELLVFTEHTSLIHIVDAETFERHQVLKMVEPRRRTHRHHRQLRRQHLAPPPPHPHLIHYPRDAGRRTYPIYRDARPDHEPSPVSFPSPPMPRVFTRDELSGLSDADFDVVRLMVGIGNFGPAQQRGLELIRERERERARERDREREATRNTREASFSPPPTSNVGTGLSSGSGADGQRMDVDGDDSMDYECTTSRAPSPSPAPATVADSTVLGGPVEGSSSSGSVAGSSRGRGVRSGRGSEEDLVSRSTSMEAMEAEYDYEAEVDVAGLTFDRTGRYVYVATTGGVVEWKVKTAEKRWWSSSALA